MRGKGGHWSILASSENRKISRRCAVPAWNSVIEPNVDTALAFCLLREDDEAEPAAGNRRRNWVTHTGVERGRVLVWVFSLPPNAKFTDSFVNLPAFSFSRRNRPPQLSICSRYGYNYFFLPNLIQQLSYGVTNPNICELQGNVSSSAYGLYFIEIPVIILYIRAY